MFTPPVLRYQCLSLVGILLSSAFLLSGYVWCALRGYTMQSSASKRFTAILGRVACSGKIDASQRQPHLESGKKSAAQPKVVKSVVSSVALQSLCDSAGSSQEPSDTQGIYWQNSENCGPAHHAPDRLKLNVHVVWPGAACAGLCHCHFLSKHFGYEQCRTCASQDVVRRIMRQIASS